MVVHTQYVHTGSRGIQRRTGDLETVHSGVAALQCLCDIRGGMVLTLTVHSAHDDIHCIVLRFALYDCRVPLDYILADHLSHDLR